MRQRSITGPLILVAVGVLFLLNNLRPGFSPFRLMAEYWPFLLIAAGVIGLIEVLVSVGRGNPAPPRPLSGGWIFWIVLWAIIAGVVNDRGGIHIRPFDMNGTTFLGSGYEYEIAASGLPLAGNGVTRVVLENIRGDVSLKGDDSGAVKVSGHKTVRAFNKTDADRADRESGVLVERRGDSVVVSVAAPSHAGDLTISTNLDISVPKGVSVEAHSRSGDLNIQNLDGTLDVTGARGDVRVDHIGGKVRIESTRGGLIRATDLRSALDLEGRGGDVQIENIAGESTVHGEFSGTLEFRALAKSLHFESQRSEFHVEAIPGEVTLDLGDLKLNNVTGPVRFQSKTRDIQANDVTSALDLQVERGDITVRQNKVPLPKIDVHLHNGDISVALPDKAGFQLKGSTRQGEVENSYGSPVETRTSGRGATIEGKTGEGQTGSGPAISLTTDRGTVSVRKL